MDDRAILEAMLQGEVLEQRFRDYAPFEVFLGGQLLGGGKLYRLIRLGYIEHENWNYIDPVVCYQVTESGKVFCAGGEA